MVQVQSTWFPVIDRNPQRFVPNIFLAKESDFQPATQRVFRSGCMRHTSHCRRLSRRGSEALRNKSFQLFIPRPELSRGRNQCKHAMEDKSESHRYRHVTRCLPAATKQQPNT